MPLRSVRSREHPGRHQLTVPTGIRAKLVFVLAFVAFRWPRIAMTNGEEPVVTSAGTPNLPTPPVLQVRSLPQTERATDGLVQTRMPDPACLSVP